ncbi:hypothetical protein [Streptomyces sp. NBC_00239]|nr:hypothetical protein [Streptomyces sp. NBC_00239]
MTRTAIPRTTNASACAVRRRRQVQVREKPVGVDRAASTPIPSPTL